MNEPWYTEQDQDDPWMRKQMEEEEEQYIHEMKKDIALHTMLELLKLRDSDRSR